MPPASCCRDHTKSKQRPSSFLAEVLLFSEEERGRRREFNQVSEEASQLAVAWRRAVLEERGTSAASAAYASPLLLWRRSVETLPPLGGMMGEV